MYQQILSHQQMHHLSQCGLVSKRMERLEVEDLLIDPLERRVRITTGRTHIGHAFCGAFAGNQSTRGRHDPRDLVEHPGNILHRQHAPDQQVTSRFHLVRQRKR